MQFGRGDDERGREQRGELFGGAEQRCDALVVLGEVAGVLAGGRLVVDRPAVPSRRTMLRPMSVTSSAKLTFGLAAILRSFCFCGLLRMRRVWISLGRAWDALASLPPCPVSRTLVSVAHDQHATKGPCVAARGIR
jgi:hypothetical protein